MRLYSGSTQNFVEDTVRNQIADKLRNAFFENFRFYPAPGEVNSWRNSLTVMSNVVQHAHLMDHGVMLEYQLPLTSKRLDCLFLGHDNSDKDHAIIVELKQWEKTKVSNCENEVMTWVGGAERDVLHPSVQVGRYRSYLQDTHTAFYEGENPVGLSACAYLHNYGRTVGDPIFSNKFEKHLNENPIFTMDDLPTLEEFLARGLEKGKGMEVLQRVEKSRYRPSRKLMDHVGNTIRGKSEYILLDEQLVVYDKVLATANQGFHDQKKTVLVVKGGPGTGKSVIAINLMADLLLKGFNAHYATGSKAFTETLRKIIGTRGSIQFKYFNSYTNAEKNEIDVLICDEAHRIRETSNNRFTPRSKQSKLPQLQELLNVSKVVVFFIDDVQVVRPNEIGSVNLFKELADKNKCEIYEYELEAQFRCSGSDGFVNWIDNTLGIRRTANTLWSPGQEVFEFKIYSDPESLEKAIRSKVEEGHTGRVTAGFCWKWSMPNQDGTLVDDVVIGDYKRPWDAKPEARHLAPGIPKASLWAYDPNGINQIGCVYTAQGFEFDYVGVIVGKDMIYNFDSQIWEGHPENNADSVVKRARDHFVDLVKNTYRVLLSRGMKGCFVHFMDKDTERFFRSRMEVAQVKEKMKILPIEFEGLKEVAYKTHLPVYSLKAAAGYFGNGVEVEKEGWIEVSGVKKLDKDMFVTKVFGKSMEPNIPDGSYCVFRANPEGTRQGKIVLAQYQGTADTETGGSYTVKFYQSLKKKNEDENGRNESITLKPANKSYAPIVLGRENLEFFKIVAEYVGQVAI